MRDQATSHLLTFPLSLDRIGALATRRDWKASELRRNMEWYTMCATSGAETNLSPRTGAGISHPLFHTAHAVGYDVSPFGLAGLCPGWQAKAPAQSRLKP